MLPLRLEIRNFLAYRSPDPLVFEGIHLACLTGANGAGKSSLLDAITWVLWGKARSNHAEDLVHLGQTDMHVQLDFEQEGTIYRVIRRRTRKSGGQGTLDLYVLRDGELETRSEPTLRDTQKKIIDLLRLDYDTFVHSAFLQQGKADAFTTKAPAQRKQILSDILGLDRWAAYEETAKERRDDIDRQVSGMESLIEQIDGELAREPMLLQTLADAEATRAEAEARRDEAEAKLKEVEHAPGDLRNAQGQKAGLERSILKRKNDLKTADGDIQAHSEKIARFEMTVAERDEIEQGYAALQAARAVDSTLGDKLRQLNDLDARRHQLERQLDAARSQLQAEVRGYESTIDGLERTIATASPDALAELQAEILTLEDLEEQRNRFQDEMIELEQKRAELKGGNEKLRVEMNNLKDRITRLGDVSGAVCPVCGQPLSEEHRVQLLDELQTEGTQRGVTFRANEAAIKQIGEDIKTAKQRVDDLNGELKRLAALKERAASLQSAVDAANDAATRLSDARARLEDTLRAIAEEAFGEEVRARIAALDGERVALGYSSEAHTAAHEQTELYRDYDERHRKLELALGSLDGERALLQKARERRAVIQAALAEDEKALDGVLADITRLEALVKEYQAREQEARVARATWQKAHEQVIVAQQELNALNAQRARKQELQEQLEAKKHERGIYDDLRLAFSKNGIPAMIIETAIPELELGANAILARMTDGRMSLTLSTQREKVTGGVAETLDIQIADELGTRSYEMYSGGESFRINFAVRVALSQLLARRAGAHLRTLFIDEGFGTQDEDGRNKLIEAITAVQDDFALILAITHIDELRDAFPVHIALEKTSEGSRVMVR